MCWPLSNCVAIGNDGSNDYCNIMIVGRKREREKSAEANEILCSRAHEIKSHTRTYYNSTPDVIEMRIKMDT